MSTRIRPLLFLAAFAAAPVSALADDTCPGPVAPARGAPAPTASDTVALHGGRIVVLGDGAASVEVLHDTRLGTLTVHPVAARGKGVLVREAPVVVFPVSKDGIAREATMTVVEGASPSWTLADEALKGDSARFASLQVRVGDAVHSATWDAANPAAQPTVLTSRSLPAPEHGGRVVELRTASVEWLHDREAGVITLWPLLARTLDASRADEAPVLSLTTSDGPRELKFTRPTADGSAWTVRDDALKGNQVAGELRIVADGRTHRLALPVDGLAATLESVKGERGGQVVALGDDAIAMEIVSDAQARRLTVHTLESSQPAVTLDEPPTLSIRTAQGKRDVNLEAVAGGTPGAWTVDLSEVRPGILAATLRAKSRAKTYQAPVALPGMPGTPIADAAAPNADAPKGDAVAESTSGRRSLKFGDLAFDFRHDAEAGTVSLFAPERPASAPLVFAGAPTLLLDGTTPRELPMAAIAGRTDAWQVSDPALRTKSLAGRVRVNVGGRIEESPIPAREADLPEGASR